MSHKQVEILLISGSPRAHTSEALLALLEEGIRSAGARPRRFLLSKKHIDPCTGCGLCSATGTCVLADGRAKTPPTDDYLELLDALAHADALAVVSPLYFAGPPAQLKALFDRMQPFWVCRYLLDQKPQHKRPAQLFILGGGGDPHGHDPLVISAKSSLAVAGFSIEKVQNFVGFKHARDVAPLPSEDSAADMAFGELAHVRKAIALQQEFEQRALAAGKAFARFVGKSMEKLELQAELQLVEAEMAKLTTDDPPQSMLVDEPEATRNTVKIMDHVDTGFEALKQQARASKATKSDEASQLAAESTVDSAVDASDSNDPPGSHNTDTAQNP